METKTDIKRLMALIQQKNYRGYLPIETLGEGNEKVRIKMMFEELRKEVKLL